MSPHADDPRANSRGFVAGVGAYFVWGLFPLYFTLLDRSGSVEVLAHRVVWTLVAMLVVLAATGTLRSLRGISARNWLVVAAATTAICINWGTYIYAVTSGQVIQAALGYFINPLVSVLLGVVIFGERLSRGQIVALVLAAVAVAVIAIDYGRAPVIALVLAFSFASYGVLKKIVPLDPRTSLAAEGIVAAPIAIGYLVFLGGTGASTFVDHGPLYAIILMAAGPVTAVPLLLFGYAAQRIPLTLLGILQYLTPIMQMLMGILVLGESMPPVRWIGFGLIWLALVIFTVESRRGARRIRADRCEEPTSGMTK